MREVISARNLPVKFDVTKTVFWLFIMDYYKAPGWIFALGFTLMIINTLIFLYNYIIDEEINLFEDDNN